MGHTDSQHNAGGGVAHSSPQGGKIVGVELVENGGQGARIGSAGQGKAAHAFEAGKVFEKDLHEARDGDVTFGAPYTDGVVSVVLDSQGDVAHMGSLEVETAFRFPAGHSDPITGDTSQFGEFGYPPTSQNRDPSTTLRAGCGAPGFGGCSFFSIQEALCAARGKFPATKIAGKSIGFKGM